ncbi:nicotianamine synthase family protein [Paenibacillus cremeus]|uniref:nicotianamine synthase family protein n=1 Tax=Paenibacillus cremeus TaxID=2163881 RepID=UPI0021BDABF8|nr:nicotianamine synthase family protein [Paenibacillus cremeus]
MEYAATDAALLSQSAPSVRISELIALVKQTYALLHQESDLTPSNPLIAEAVSTLSRLVTQTYSPDEVQRVLKDTTIAPLRAGLLAKLSEAECLMELFDSRRLHDQHDLSLAELRRYPNWDRYEALVGAELELLARLRRAGDAERPIVFVGSGPVPLSAVILHLQEKVPVVCVDVDPAACESARLLLERVGLGEAIRVSQGDGADFDYAPFRHVFVASLVTRKTHVLAQIRRTRADALVAVRTAAGMRQLMYEAVDEQAMAFAGWRLLGRSSPRERQVINSTLFYRLEHI